MANSAKTGKSGFLGFLKLNSDLDRLRLFSAVGFFLMVVSLAWQSDDAYHGYVMSRHLAEGAGLVYNLGERSTASTCPLFTLVIAAAYFVTREMYFTSIMVCALFSLGAYCILAYKICRSKEQLLIAFIALTGSQAFISYTTSGLENSLLFFLSALFLWELSKKESYNALSLLRLALVFSCLAMARMDSVLIFIPVILWAYLFKRDNVSFPKAVGIGILGLLPFILWELFALFYFGFPFPNPAYVKLGSGIATIEYIKRGLIYGIYTALDDLTVVIVPFIGAMLCLIQKKLRYIMIAAGIFIYYIYIVRIGGDFMMGRHFTNLLFVAVCTIIMLQNDAELDAKRLRLMRSVFNGAVVVTVFFALGFGRTVGSQYLAGHLYSSQISDEREYYFDTTGLYNNVVSLIKTGRLKIPETWNDEAPRDLRERKLCGGILDNAAGILVYYNSDLYLNDTYALGDPFLSKLPASYNPNWRVGHLRRELPGGYRTSIWSGKNEIRDKDLHKYYDIIRLITRGRLWDGERLKAILDINLGRYNYLIENYMDRKEAGK
ncbi:MAG: hypothetical protein J6O55_01340 [Lachnospiraceae bacterium]|nr:hypothetical protein [Lachnospiraceae bacterium]